MQMPPANLVTGRGKSQDSHSALGTKAREAANQHVMSRGFLLREGCPSCLVEGFLLFCFLCFFARLIWRYCNNIVSLRVYYRNSLRVALFSGKFGANSPRNEVQRWFRVIYKSLQIEAAGLLLELCMQISRGCCGFFEGTPCWWEIILQETNIVQLGKSKVIFKHGLGGDMFVPRGVYVIFNYD